MNRFNFRLQRVLDIRETVEELKKRNLEKSIKALNDEFTRLTEMSLTLESSQNRLRVKISGRLNVIEIQSYFDYFNMLNKLIDLQEHRIDDAKKVVTSKRDELIKATKEKKILEKLKEKAWSLYKVEMGREEQNLIDEIAIQKFKKKRQ